LNNKHLSSLLATIERNLTDWIPMGVKEMKTHSPAYCLFVWYQDFSGDLTPHIGIATLDLIKSAESMKFVDPNEKFDVLWRPQQCADLKAPGSLFIDECDIVENEVEDCYEILAKESGLFDDEDDDEEDKDADDELNDEDADGLTDGDDDDFDDEEDVEFETIAPFREMMHRVGKNLRTVDWKRILPVTEDFVVVVCDYVGYWLAEDFELSVSPEQIARLTKQGLLPSLDEES
jgi:hypothetical protein